MRPFLHLYFALLLPISLPISLFFLVYFTSEYNFTQSITLGILYGLFAGVFVTFIVTTAITLLGKNQYNLLSKLKITKKEKTIDKSSETIQGDSSPKQHTHANKHIDQKLILLMNKELIFGIILTMIKKQIKYSITKHNIDTGKINIKIHNEIISISVTVLTKHTSQININGMNNSENIQNIISFIKETEHSFLQY